MTLTRRRAQSLVELALVAPLLILLAMLVWDGGSVLREQVILNQAARDGARAAATAYSPGATSTVVTSAVLASARDLPSLAGTPGYLTLTYGAPDAQSARVDLRYNHVLWTPILSKLWTGGTGTMVLTASAVFYVPQLTPVPPTIVPSTPLPTGTPSATPTLTPVPATPTLTPPPGTATPTPGLRFCVKTITIPGGWPTNTGYYLAFTLDTASPIVASWNVVGGQESDVNGNAEIDIYPPSVPFTGANPVTGRPAGALATGFNFVFVGNQNPATYTAYFYNSGRMDSPSSGSVAWIGRVC